MNAALEEMTHQRVVFKRPFGNRISQKKTNIFRTQYSKILAANMQRLPTIILALAAIYNVADSVSNILQSTS